MLSTCHFTKYEVVCDEVALHSFFYKNNFIRTRASYLTKSSEQTKTIRD